MRLSWITTGGILAAAVLAVDGLNAEPTSTDITPVDANPVETERPLQQEELDGRALYLTNCATCHGETGDGKGVTQLDRPARSFLLGGFSYGNTNKAVLRTISNGIPGTPMPAFDSSTTAAQRDALAAYVISLGPERVVVDPDSTIMEVDERPLMVRGYLPPIAPGTKSHPRGLLLGGTDGLTFEYRVDDVRLLGVRAGGFVQRRDWEGRGGSALKPLGKVVYLCEGGGPRSSFSIETGTGGDVTREDLQAKLTATWVRGETVGLSMMLLRHGENLMEIEEQVQAIGTSLAAGFRRTFKPIELNAKAQSVMLAVDTTSAADVVHWYSIGGTHGVYITREDGSFDILIARSFGRSGAIATQPSLYPQQQPGGGSVISLIWQPKAGDSMSLDVLSGTNLEFANIKTILEELGQ
ncbi:MAG: mono/diheme cytochrome c family protein [Planctomycetota bacterium]|jgi:mono/diheme cytochrome c family protein